MRLSLAAHLRIGAGALALGEFLSDLDLVGGAGHGQGLLVGVYGDEFYAFDSRFHHAVDHVGTTAANADHLNIHNGLCPGI